MSARANETATVLGRLEFAALLARQDPSPFPLRRVLAALFTSRMRHQFGHLTASLGGELEKVMLRGDASASDWRGRRDVRLRGASSTASRLP